jgi:hypothetical protein
MTPSVVTADCNVIVAKILSLTIMTIFGTTLAAHHLLSMFRKVKYESDNKSGLLPSYRLPSKVLNFMSIFPPW